MNFNVRNENIKVDKIQILGIGSSSMLKIGDTESIQLSAAYAAPLTGKYLGSKFAIPGHVPLSQSGAAPVHVGR